MSDWLQLADTAGDDPEPVDQPRWPIALAVLLVVLAAVLVAWSR